MWNLECRNNASVAVSVEINDNSKVVPQHSVGCWPIKTASLPRAGLVAQDCSGRELQQMPDPEWEMSLHISQAFLPPHSGLGERWWWEETGSIMWNYYRWNLKLMPAFCQTMSVMTFRWVLSSSVVQHRTILRLINQYHLITSWA